MKDRYNQEKSQFYLPIYLLLDSERLIRPIVRYNQKPASSFLLKAFKRLKDFKKDKNIYTGVTSLGAVGQWHMRPLNSEL